MNTSNKVKVVIFNCKKLFSMNFNRITMAEADCQFVVNLTTNASQLQFWSFVNCQSTPSRPSLTLGKNHKNHKYKLDKLFVSAKGGRFQTKKMMKY